MSSPLAMVCPSEDAVVEALGSPLPFPTRGFRLGSLELASRALMAPMMGYNEPAIRRIAKRYGSGFSVTEMIKPEQLTTANRQLERELKIKANERPVGAQISCREPDLAVAAALDLQDRGFDFIDLNFGCPNKKECGRGRGAAMMREPERIGEVVSALVAVLDCPVTVKLRSGWSDEEPTAPRAARLAVDAGASLVCVHGRSKLGRYATANDRRIIRETREAVPEVPFVANGDVVDVASAASLILETGADAVMIGRAAVGNPWLLRDVAHYLATGELLAAPSYEEIKGVYFEHAEAVLDALGNKNGFRMARKYAYFYFARLIGAEARRCLGAARDFDSVRSLIAELGPARGGDAAALGAGSLFGGGADSGMGGAG